VGWHLSAVCTYCARLKRSPICSYIFLSPPPSWYQPNGVDRFPHGEVDATVEASSEKELKTEFTESLTRFRRNIARLEKAGDVFQSGILRGRCQVALVAGKREVRGTEIVQRLPCCLNLTTPFQEQGAGPSPAAPFYIVYKLVSVSAPAAIAEPGPLRGIFEKIIKARILSVVRIVSVRARIHQPGSVSQ